MQDLTSLLILLKKGEPQAQQQLFTLYKNRLLALCYRYTSDRNDAQDVLQDSFVKIFSNIEKVESADTMDSWIRQITVRTAINFYHKKKRSLLYRIEGSDFNSANEDYEYLLSGIADSELLALVNTLPLGSKIIFNLHAIEGYSHEEIADLLNINAGTSRSQFHYGKKLLQSKLKSLGITRYEKYA